MRTLRAGPLSLLLEEEGGGLRRLSVAGHEIVRRIYPAVRDRDWNSVPVRVWNVDVKDDGSSFSVSYLARCEKGDIDFAWRGQITGDLRGTLSYRMDGQARSSFLRNRIGLCVLHPLRACAGQPAAVETADGGQRRGSFPRYIWPQPPFTNFLKLWHSPAPGLRVRLVFGGDLFEMEDQRNWTDASFKTYSTPVGLPRPVETPKGTVVDQTVVVTLEEAAPEPRPAPEPVLTLDAKPGRFLPRLGLGCARRGVVLRPREIDRLRALRPAHLRVDLRYVAADWPDVLRRALEEAQAVGCALEVALHLSAEGSLDALRAAFTGIRAPIARVLLFQDRERVVSVPRARAVKEVLAPLLPGVPIGGGSNGHFEDVNTGEPAKEWDAVCWPATPQVHAHDDLTLFENLEGIGAQLVSARLFCGEKPLIVSPLTLLPRTGPGSSGPAENAAGVDDRQWSLVGAAWTLGSLKQLAEAGASSATYYETAGAQGVMDRDPRNVYPLYHVFADAGELAGARVVPCRSGDPLAFDGLALAAGEQRRVLLANFSAEPRRVAVTPLPPRVSLKRLNEETALDATFKPEAWRAAPGQDLDVPSGRLELDLAPWEYVRIDA